MKCPAEFLFQIGLKGMPLQILAFHQKGKNYHTDFGVSQQRLEVTLCNASVFMVEN